MTTATSPLAAYRLSTNLTLKAIGLELGVNRSTVLRWETGRVPAERVREVARVTGISPNVLRPDLFSLGAEGSSISEHDQNAAAGRTGHEETADARPHGDGL